MDGFVVRVEGLGGCLVGIAKRVDEGGEGRVFFDFF